MLRKLKSAAGLIVQAVAQPRAVVYALRERGLGHVLHHLIHSDADSIQTMARDVRFRSLPATRENLAAYYHDICFETPEDPDHHTVRLPSGELFLIRKTRGWHDLGTLYDTFVKQIYARHPAVDGKTVLDIGANIGDTAVYFGVRGAHVIAYEPDPQMCELAARNAALNNVQADFRNAGIGAANQTLSLSATADGADSMSTTLFAKSRPVNRLHVTTIPARIVAFADALRELGAVFLMKFDCEGCEYPAIASVSDDDLRRVQHMIIEFHDRAQPLAERLAGAGFTARVRDETYLFADRIGAREGGQGSVSSAS